MQISFNPTDSAQRLAVLGILHLFDGTADAMRIHTHTHTHTGTALAQAGIGTDATGEQDNRSAASVFAGAAPLSDVQLGAGATPLDNAPAGQSASLPGMPAGMPGLAVGGPSTGAPSGSAPAGNPAGGVELDAQGIPWHHEIHASTKSKTKGGEWTKLRGLNDEAKYNRIVAELKALHAMPPAGGAAPLGGTAGALPAGQPAATTPLVGTLPQGLPPLQPLQSLAPTVPQNFDEMMPRITAAIVAKIVPEDVVAAACTARQLPGIVALVSRPDFVPIIWGDIQARFPALV